MGMSIECPTLLWCLQQLAVVPELKHGQWYSQTVLIHSLHSRHRLHSCELTLFVNIIDYAPKDSRIYSLFMICSWYGVVVCNNV